MGYDRRSVPGTASSVIQPVSTPREALEQTPVTALRGVGPKLAQQLAAIHINSVADLLFHLPLRYQDRTRVTPIRELAPGMEVVVEGKVLGVRQEFGRRRSLSCTISDASGILTLRFFHFSGPQQRVLEQAGRLRCYGEARRGRNGVEMFHPEFRLIDELAPAVDEEALTPVYPTTEGLHQASWRKLSEQALLLLERGALRELVPPGLLPGDVPLAEALRFLHRPPPDAPTEQLLAGEHPYQQRLAAEELLAHHLSLLRLRERARRQGAARLTGDPALQQRFLAALPFALTGAQLRVAAEIARDLDAGVPMLRLVQGDVGCGKTLVAALACLQAISSGWQVAVMAPTELLAEQHLRNFEAWMEPLGIRTVALSGRQGAVARRTALAALDSGEAMLAIGTHALFQEEVRFARLGLVVIDEQHRFGVHQRLQLREKGTSGGLAPHQLIMTATPIPRTLAMTAYADLDYSVIDELPPGRTPVGTVVINNSRRYEVVERVRHACADGRQAYWVCTLIEESEVLEAQAAEAIAEELTATLPELRIALVHGRQPGRERSALMASFKAGEIDLLVATTVIEVGVDVPRASLMIIENAERLGLAQLHQLRGRVGRGATASHCVLMYQTPLSATGRERLHAMRDTTDGFKLAEIDLRLRGPGELLGTRQTGTLEMRFADLSRDADLLPLVRTAAERLLRECPGQVEPLLARWMAGRERYAEA
jgi:ATP-dependent DNA helicase RecG